MADNNIITKLEKVGFLPYSAAIIIGMIGSVYIYPQSSIPIMLGLCVYALRGPKEAIQSLTISIFLIFVNPGIFPKPELVWTLRWLILISAFIGIILYSIRHKQPLPKHVLGLLYFSAIIGSISLVVSYQPEFSIFRLFQFTMGAVCILIAYQYTDSKYWDKWFTNFFLVVVVLSLPLYFLPLGYLRNDVGFQGIFNHPQAMGVFVAPFAAWFTLKILTGEGKTPYTVIFFTLSWFILYSTKARGGAAAALIGVSIAIFLLFIYGGYFTKSYKTPRTGLGTIAFLSIACIILFLNFDFVQESVSDFVKKGRSFERIDEGFELSRGFLIQRSMNNFREHPITGIGFGVRSDLSGPGGHQRSEMLGFLIGGSAEKGFLPSAILEETGLVGAFLFIVMLGMLARTIFTNGSRAKQAMFIGVFLVNLGESIFFSLGGLGLFMWLIIGYTATNGTK